MNERLRHIVFPVVIVAMMVYFTYHIFQGQRGVLAWIRLDKKLKEQEITLNALTKEKEYLEKEAYLLRPDSLDIDLLEEKSRQVLNFAHPDEVVVQVGS
jgi:cell division protein FtsB